jgi:hypothetical protein
MSGLLLKGAADQEGPAGRAFAVPRVSDRLPKDRQAGTLGVRLLLRIIGKAVLTVDYGDGFQRLID